MELLANRYNSQFMITMLMPWGSSINFNKRWQVSLRDKNNKCHDYFFKAKPTRKQVRKLHRKRNVE